MESDLDNQTIPNEFYSHVLESNLVEFCMLHPTKKIKCYICQRYSPDWRLMIDTRFYNSTRNSLLNFYKDRKQPTSINLFH